MRVGFPGGPRLEWYDRNPQECTFTYAGDDVAPHSSTVRWTYTVPTGKKLFVESAVALVTRVTAADTASEVVARVTARAMSLLRAKIYTNAVGDKDHMNVGRSVIMLAGSVLQGSTADLSTAGTIDFLATLHGIEFDA